MYDSATASDAWVRIGFSFSNKSAGQLLDSMSKRVPGVGTLERKRERERVEALA